MLRFSTSLLVALSILASAASAQQNPKLTINGTTSTDNNAVAHMKRQTPFTISMTGTPNTPFALLLSGDALNGEPVNEQDINSGFFLNVWQPGGGVFSPIHPVFDGIGTTVIASKLGQPGSNFVSDNPSPVFKFDANGNFSLSGLTPTTAFLLNTGSGSNPIVLPLESVSPNTIALFFQIVEIDIQTLALRTGNGMKVIFDPLEFPGTIAYSEGIDSNVNTLVVSQRQTLSTIVDTNLTDASLGSITSDVNSFGASSGGNIDAWLIELAGIQQIYASSHLSALGEVTPSNWAAVDPNLPANQNPQKTIAQTLRASGIEVLNAAVPVLNNDNPEFPRIELPGNRSLFCWRNGANAGLPTYGFGVVFKDTGTFKNLIPTSFGTFIGTVTLSAFEWEVGVTPDGNRAVVVISAAVGVDRLFILNLEPGATTTITEVLNTTAPADWTTLYEESLTFLKDGQGGWVGFIAGATTATTGTQPNRLYRFNLQGSQNVAKILPGIPAPSNGIVRVDRQPFPSDDFTRLCIVAGNGNTTQQNEQVYGISAITPTSETLTNMTGFAGTTLLNEWHDARDGTNGRAAMSPDGSLFAFSRNSGVQNIPMFAKTDGSSAGTVTDLITPTSTGGDFDILSDFKNTRDYFLCPDNNTLVFMQGIENTGMSTDRMDIFKVTLSTKIPFNLTRTITCATPDQEANGPFDLSPFDQNFTRPTMDPCGSWRSPNKRFIYYFRDAHGLSTVDGVPFDRFNPIAINVGSDALFTPPTFEVTNITGSEFEPFFGAGIPTSFTEDMNGRGNLFTEGLAIDQQVRHLGGTGPFASYFYLLARKTNPVDVAQLDIDQVLIFDADNPGPGFYLTSFATNSSPIAVSAGARMSNLLPSLSEPKIGFALDRDGATVTFQQDVIVFDLENFGNPIRITSGGSAFTKLLTRASMHFLPTQPQSLVYAFGTVARPVGGTIDGNSASIVADPNNPIDATAFVYRFDTATSLPIVPDAPGGFRRGVMVWGVHSP